MTILRKIAAILVMILAVVGLLICLAGLIGAWVVNKPVTNAVTGVLGTANDYLGLANQATQTADATVSDVTQRLNDLGQAATRLEPGSEGADRRPRRGDHSTHRPRQLAG